MAISAALDTDIPFVPDNKRNGLISEFVKITGSTGAAGDTATYTPSYCLPIKVIGMPYAISAGVITFTADVALSNNNKTVEVLGYPK